MANENPTCIEQSVAGRSHKNDRPIPQGTHLCTDRSAQTASEAPDANREDSATNGSRVTLQGRPRLSLCQFKYDSPKLASCDWFCWAATASANEDGEHTTWTNCAPETSRLGLARQSARSQTSERGSLPIKTDHLLTLTKFIILALATLPVAMKLKKWDTSQYNHDRF
jgi:hypothetical protein